MAEELGLPTDADIEELAAELDLSQERVLNLFRHLGLPTDLQATMDLELSTAGPGGFGVPEPGQRTTASLSLKILRNRNPERFRAVWAIITQGDRGPDSSGYREAYDDWVDGNADPVRLADRFGFEAAPLFGPDSESSALADASDDQIEDRARLVNEFTSDEERDAILASIVEEQQLRLQPADTQAAIRQIQADQEAAESELQGAIDEAEATSLLNNERGLYTPEEMNLIAGFVNANRGFGQTPSNAAFSGLLSGIEGPIDPATGASSGLLGARSNLVGERFTINFDTDLFGTRRQTTLGLFTENPSPIDPNQVNRGFTPDGAQVVEPVDAGRGQGGFLTGQQAGSRFVEDSGLSFNDARQLLSRMDEDELSAMQHELWRMGYYGEQAIAAGSVPRWGINETSTQQAYFDFMLDVFVDPSRDATVVRNRKRRETFGLFQELKNQILGQDEAAQGIDIAGIRQSFNIAADEDVESRIQATAQSTIGQRLTANEVETIKALFRQGEQEEIDQSVGHLQAQQEAQAALARQQSRRTRFLAHTGGIRLYDEFGELITPTKNPNRGFDPTGAGGVVDPVAGFTVDNVAPTPADLQGVDPNADIVGPDVISTIEAAPTVGAVTEAALRANHGSRVFARDMSRTLGTLRSMMDGERL